MFQINSKSFKKMTIVGVSLFLFSSQLLATVLTTKNLKGYFRIFIHAAKSDVRIERSASGVEILTSNKELFAQLKKEVKKITFDKRFISKVETLDQTTLGKLKIQFKTPNVVFFNFYRDREKSSIIDVWSEGSSETAITTTKTKLVTKKLPVKLARKLAPQKRKVTPKKRPATVIKKSSKIVLATRSLFKYNKEFRDFRYGAPFIWNYAPLAPELKPVISLKRKTVEYFYPIRDRDYEKNDQEAHLQLIINLYRKKKWGLMYKAMNLFARKYGDDTESDLIEYLKANALFKNNLLKDNSPKQLKNAVNVYQALSMKVKDYELKKSLIKFLIQYHLDDKNYVEALALAKRLYVIVQNNFDMEESPFALDVILTSLAKLGQVKRIDKLVNDKTVVKIVPKLRLAAFKIYALMKLGHVDKAIDYYEHIQKTFSTTDEKSILFNMAEAYFRNAQLKKAVKLFDRFIVKNSEHRKSSQARLRIALSYDLLEKNPKIVAKLYDDAINHSTMDKVSIEAKLRYVAFRKIRKRVLTQEDKNVAYLLKFSESPKLITGKLEKLLWIVRLRSFIVDHEYLKALSYLNAIPISSLSPEERRTFNGDGAEIVLGIIKKSYLEANYSKIIRLWDIYQSKYIDRVARDPYVNYIVGRSYIMLGLYESFDQFYTTFANKKNSPVRKFPEWIVRDKKFSAAVKLKELVVIKNIQLKNWSVALNELNKIKIDPVQKDFYLALIHFNLKHYKKTITFTENFLIAKKTTQQNTIEDLARLINAYMKSIYRSGNMKKYIKVGRALVRDLRRQYPKNIYIKNTLEEIEYMIIEDQFAKEKFQGLVDTIKKFQEVYKSSVYKDRINYLLGVAYVRTNNVKAGEAIFKKIINEKNIPDYLKELSKTELSLIKIKNKLI